MGHLGPGVPLAIVVDDEGGVCRTLASRVGLPVASPGELGLSAPGSLGGPEAAARFWAEATRRPALAAGGTGIVLARPDGGTGLAESAEEAAEVLSLAAVQRPPRRVAVFGAAWVEEGEETYEEARRFGRAVAEGGVQVASGGYWGVMAAVTRGAVEAGGMALGISIEAWAGRVEPNPWLTHEVRARDLFARLPLLFDADAWVAFPGGAGTLAEVALGWNLAQTTPGAGRPLLVVGEAWEPLLATFRDRLILTAPEDLALIEAVPTAEAAAARVVGL